LPLEHDVSHLVYNASRWLAWFGALVLVVISVITVTSIVGRALSFAGLGPVRGDFELVEAGTALAVFSFMPWCHLQRGHAVVDMLWKAFPAPMQRVLDVLTNLLMLVVWLVLVWRMGVAMLEYRGNGEVSFILQMPVWWGYAASLLPAAIGCVAYAWRLLESVGLATPPAGFVAVSGGH
jgi:TRAP-type C4-dicarboxylate transport system permease small subunit